jgi:acyl-CoA reductase-like NAD-dependent aldehyde dehydrogenase
VAFTGSTSAGRQVAALCGEHLKHSTLELGGKSAAIVLEDVDLDARLASLITSAMPNTGQVCYATTRILVPRSRSSEIVDALAAAVASMKVGDPHDADTRIGPLVAERQRDRVESYIRSGREQGAAIVLGGGRPRGLDRGWFVEPTIFAHVDNSLKIAQEEIFGPVLCLIDYESVDEAVAIANDSQYGLGGGVFTEDVVHALDIVSKIRTGTCVINSGAPGGGGGPFGGMKNSGLGRERGIEGYASCYELKSVALPAGVDIGR